jgi:hypothetical protein
MAMTTRSSFSGEQRWALDILAGSEAGAGCAVTSRREAMRLRLTLLVIRTCANALVAGGA